jgi:sugar phosphate isomerase/epimerase
MNRRDFLKTTALGATAAALATQLPDLLEKDVAGTIQQLAKIGYKDVEIYSLYRKPAAEFKKILTDNGVTASSGHYMLKDVQGEWDKRIDDANTLGLQYMVNAILQEEERKSFDDYKRLVDVFNKAGEATQKAGIQFCYHNHNFEFTKYGDTTAYDFFLNNLDPKLVKYEMDCFWVTHAGEDPVAYFDKYPGRFPLLHIKDMKDKPAPTHELDAKMGLFAPVGHGSIDWKRIFAAAKKGGMQHYYVEEDYCEQPPLQAIKMSYDYLSKLSA